MENNLILIGMPGAGKSTVGVVLAKTLGKVFIDTDLLIQQSQQRLLQEIIREDGVTKLLAVEEQVILQLQAENTVIATGGSVVYSSAAMARLKDLGLVVYLQLPLAELETRITNMASRGIVMRPDQQLSDLYRERRPLYEKYADLTVDCTGLSLEAAATVIINGIKNRGQAK